MYVNKIYYLDKRIQYTHAQHLSNFMNWIPISGLFTRVLYGSQEFI